MGGFSAAWLALREPFDAAARDGELTRRFADAIATDATIVDLGGGSGSNVRFITPHLTVRHRWRVVDADPGLLAHAARLPNVTTIERDLTADLAPALANAGAVTSSALMDLVSAAWFDRLALALAAARLPFLAALSVDGRDSLDPGDPDDAPVLGAFAQHQGRDKGFGPALGPAAPAYMAQRLSGLGYTIQQRRSDWQIGRTAVAMHRELLTGMATAAGEAAPPLRARIESWLERRLAQAAAGTLATHIGHIDLLAVYARRA